MNARAKVAELLNSVGAVLKRSKRHEIWKLPNGKALTRAKTPSDCMGDRNNLTDLRKQLGESDPQRGAPGERRVKRNKPGRDHHPRITAAPKNTVFAEKLSAAGIVEAELRARIRSLGKTIHRQNNIIRKQNSKINSYRFILNNHWTVRLCNVLARMLATRGRKGRPTV